MVAARSIVVAFSLATIVYVVNDALVPDTVGRYRVVRRMTTGATADVLLASETLNGVERPVVLKVMLEKYACDEHFMELFRSATSAYGRLADSDLATSLLRRLAITGSRAGPTSTSGGTLPPAGA